MYFVDPSLSVPICYSCLAHNAAYVGEAINFLDGLAINSEGGFLACIYLHTPGLCDIDLYACCPGNIAHSCVVSLHMTHRV